MKTFTNPIIYNSEKCNTSDPYVIFHNGVYYHCYGNKQGVYVSAAKRLEDIGKASPKLVYGYTENNIRYFDWYAPELHLINNVWYIYGSPDMGNGYHSMAVLQNKNADPTTPFINKGVIHGLENKWSLDGTVLEYCGKNYFIWSSGKQLLISELVTPWEIKNEGSVIGTLEFGFEKTNGEVMEGPAILRNNGNIFLVYSVNDSATDDYCMGLMRLKGKDPLKKENWEKQVSPVFAKTEKVFGPGHCCFTKVANGGTFEDYMLYHANLKSGTGWNGRSVWAQEVKYDKTGMPVFGKPVV